MSEKQQQVLDYFSADQLKEIETTIVKAEKQTSGEIRVEIILDCDHDLMGRVHEQAVRDFETAGMHKTRDKTGILILIVLNERTFTILGDSGIYSKLPQGYWDNMAKAMTLYFKDGNFHVGICAVVESIGRQLAKYFPRRNDDVDELSDEVIVGGSR
ncbi:MAG: hypothetical protein A2915_00655 [Candidatus Yanofskybacteria bacterium RIFCSPLOWO2_01_FULL_41_34]|uniref:TPM domain-containing protein n=1 Tax=Candidatus Yanofskybacteria bacterium RIFCSPHIGHO2_01_FULL_41_26 TaxID=1802661 RepID=A0A1F8ECH1_9BACT|nr:MAG: hypothetical protein A2649_02685 [Candidatus Yanofskybacteria bacterium RIFCSPHIGHO2_01_FULL_41_26]OGN22408.1 MAG: hypothetical protein A2915_00655 [Candidatus Yanofskybacteria bacterium RIFCSPLOWO2_01_FULL_41_34]